MSVEFSPDDERLIRLEIIETVSTELFTAVWRAIIRGTLSERGPIADSALRLRDALNPDWPLNSDWLPEELAGERDAGYPGL